MKKLNLIAVLILLGSVSAYAQEFFKTQTPTRVQTRPSQPRFYLNGIVGYTFDESFSVNANGRSYQGKLQSATHYGGSIELVVGESSRYSERTLEISYQASPTTLEGWKRVNGIFVPDARKVGVNYLTLGFNGYFGKSRKVMGYGGINLGAGWGNDKTSSESVTKFAIGLKGGGRFMFTEKVGLKLYAQLNTLIGGIAGGFVFGTGGSGVAVGAQAAVAQFGLGGGLTFGLGGD